MPVLEYLGLAVILCAVSYPFARAYERSGGKSTVAFVITVLLCIPSLPISLLFYSCQQSAEARAQEERQKTAKVVAVIAAVDVFPENEQEAAWQNALAHSYLYDFQLPYYKWRNKMFDEYGLNEGIFSPSSEPRLEMQILRDKLSRS